MSGLVDVDCNLLHDQLCADADALCARAEAVGVAQWVVPGSTLLDSAAALRLATERRGAVFGTAGVHPFNAPAGGAPAAALERLAALGEAEGCVAIGECGLDGADGFPPLEAQLPWFTAQLDLAVRLRKPVFLHERLAFGAVRRELEARAAVLPPVLVHCFTGTPQELEWYVAFGCSISLSGFVMPGSRRGAELRRHLQDNPRAIPLERLMVETDAPYMGFKGCRAAEPEARKKSSPNVPSALPLVAAELGRLLGAEAGVVEAATAANARRFFGLP